MHVQISTLGRGGSLSKVSHGSWGALMMCWRIVITSCDAESKPKFCHPLELSLEKLRFRDCSKSFILVLKLYLEVIIDSPAISQQKTKHYSRTKNTVFSPTPRHIKQNQQMITFTSKEFSDCKIFHSKPKSQGSSPCSTTRQSGIRENYLQQNLPTTRAVSSRDPERPISVCLKRKIKKQTQSLIPFQDRVEAFLSTTENYAAKPLFKKTRENRRIELQKFSNKIQNDCSFKLATQKLLNKYYGNKFARHFWKEKPTITKFIGEQILSIKRYGAAAVKRRYASQTNSSRNIQNFMYQKNDDAKNKNDCHRPQSHKIMKMMERQIIEKRNRKNSDEIIQFCPWNQQEQMFDDMTLPN